MKASTTEYPDYWHVLSESDQIKYRELQHEIYPFSFRTTRVATSFKLQLIMTQIKRFAIRQDCDDWKRCLVCGIVWFVDAIAVNTRQMTSLTGRSKSSINAAFQALGWPSMSLSMSASHAISLLNIFPFLRHNCGDFRQWTIRVKMNGLRMVQHHFSEIEKSMEKSVEKSVNVEVEYMRSGIDLDDVIFTSNPDPEYSFEFASSFD
jgi:hypothetical protein